MGWLKVQPYGRSGAPGVVALDAPEATLVEPPLQSRANVLQTLWIVPGPAAVWLEVDREGKSARRQLPLRGPMPVAAVAAWTRNEEPLSVTMFLVENQAGTVQVKSVRLPSGEESVLRESEGRFVGLEIDQWMGFAWVHLLTKVTDKDPRTGDPIERLDIARWSLDEGIVTPGRGWSLPLAPDGLRLEDLRQTVSLPEGAGIALLFENADGWIACTAGDRARIQPPADAQVRHPHLVATPAGVCFTFHEDRRGFSALPVFERRG